VLKGEQLADRPLLMIPRPTRAKRAKRGGGGGRIRTPSRAEQGGRLDASFAQIRTALANRSIRVASQVAGSAPEDVVVLETVGRTDELVRAAANVPGLEWLAEAELEGVAPTEHFFVEDKPNKELSGRLYALFTNQTALEELIRLWKRWKRGHQLPRGFGPFKTVFVHLSAVRRWDHNDRLEGTGILQDWAERIDLGDEQVPAEVELWYRQSSGSRADAERTVRRLVEAAGGKVHSSAVVEQIRYHALSARLPIKTVRQILERGPVKLIHCEHIRFFATGQMLAPAMHQDRQVVGDGPFEGLAVPPPGAKPVAALLDGLPVQNHPALMNRLVVDDPDSLASDYPVAQRRHGTAMASLILHGELDAPGPCRRPLYVRPILRPDTTDFLGVGEETSPHEAVLVDLVHRAVRRIVEVAPTVALVNLSIGLRDRPYNRFMSPLAQLLDWMAAEYGLLFIVSAGNYSRGPAIEPSEAEFASMDGRARKSTTIRTLHGENPWRKVLSPGEALNALTVGAAHDDQSPAHGQPSHLHDPLQSGDLPSVLSAQGFGHGRSVKPDILMAGGRVLLEWQPGASSPDQRIFGILPPGQRHASPPNRSSRSRGTSNATALVTRAGVAANQVLEDLRGGEGGEVIDTVPRGLWIRCLLAHGARWGELEQAIRDGGLSDTWQVKYAGARLAGFGRIRPELALTCTRLRAVALGGGSLRNDEAHVHKFPLPQSLSARRGRRRLTVTLAWFTPVNPRNQQWRRAHLWFSVNHKKYQLHRQDVDWRSVQRGTLQHEVFEGHRAIAIDEGDSLSIQVNCREAAGSLQVPVAYALAVSLELAPALGVDVYAEVRQAIRSTVRPVVRT